ncbi:MAG: phosphomannomutase/phosphoglucomutase [Bacilli bacterium]
MELNKAIFREYDIRGIYPNDINEEVAYYVGRAYATKLLSFGKNKCIVGYDNRSSSESIEKNLIRGLTDSGVDVVRLGLVTTPMYYYAWDRLNIKCGIMITASHNPKEYNGFKMSYNGIHNMFGKDVMDLYYVILNNVFSEGNGTVSSADIREDYIKMIHSHINMGNNKLKVVYDCGNGTTSVVAKDIFVSNDNIEYIPLFATSDPNFPNHHPDPSVEENLKQLEKKVLELKADCGIAFDGDGDRVGVVDEKGNMIAIDKYMVIIWRDIYDKVKNKKGFYDVKCSNVLHDELLKLGIEPICVRTGNSYTKKISIEGNYPLGGELSGHVYFRDRFIGTDDGIYAGLRFVEILSRSQNKASQLLNNITKYYSTPEEKWAVDDAKKEKIVNRVEEYCKDNNYNILTIDGVKVLYDDGFALIRKSNTGPNITTRYEAKSQERLDEIKNEFDSLLNKLKEEE